MIDVALMIALVGGLIFLAHLFSWLFSFTAIPDGLLLMLVGMLLGAGLGLVTPEYFGEIGSLLLTITLVIMLFEGGTKLQISAVRTVWPRTLRLAITSFALVMAVVGLIVWQVVQIPLVPALIFGAIVGGTSSAIVIPLLNRIHAAEDSKTILVLESAISDVLAIVITIALIQAYISDNVAVGQVGSLVVVSFVYAAIVGVAGALLWSLVLDKFRHVQNSLFVTPALVFLLFGLVEWLGFSGPITALAFGITIGNIGGLNEYLAGRHPMWRWFLRPVSLSKRERDFFAEIVFLLQTFFFVYMGIAIQLGNIGVMTLAALLALLLLVLRFVAVRATIPKATPIEDATLMSVMVPKGLAAAVLATLVVQQGVAEGPIIQELTYALVLWSIVITSLFVFLLYRAHLIELYRSLFRGYGRGEVAPMAQQQPQSQPPSRYPEQ